MSDNILTEKADRLAIIDEAKRRSVMHKATAQSHFATANHLVESVRALMDAAKNCPNPKQMKFLNSLAEEHKKSLYRMIVAHRKAAISHQKAAVEHKRVAEDYNGNPDAFRDAKMLSRQADLDSSFAAKSHD